MIQEAFIIRSSISSSLIKRTLLRGYSFAFLGILIMLFTGIFLPLHFVQQWGWSLFLLSFSLITLGLLPYRRLSRLQLKPHKLIVTSGAQAALYLNEKKILTLPLESVAYIRYIDHAYMYGIAIWLTTPPPLPIVIHQLPREVNKLRNKAKKMGKADLFLPYFNQRAYDELVHWQDEQDVDEMHFKCEKQF